VSDATDLAARVAEFERDALAQLDAVLAGVAMCRVTGAAEHPAKYWEGRSAVLAQVRRALRRTPPGDEAAALDAIHRQWSKQLDSMTADTWRVYTNAGLEALKELM
jgi:hypothetical protein